MQALTDVQIISHLNRSFENAASTTSRCPDDVMDILGESGKKQRHLYSNICSIGEIKTLEIGRWQAPTMIACLYNNTASALVINPPEQTTAGVERYNDLLRQHLQDRATICAVACDLDTIAVQEVREYGLFDVVVYDISAIQDTSHFARFSSCLQSRSILIICNWNAPEVRSWTFTGLNETGYDIVYMRAMMGNDHGDNYTRTLTALEDYWKGVAVILIKRRQEKEEPQLILKDPECRLVVARYNENIEWTDAVSDVVVYNKGCDISCPHPCVSLPNIGRETQTYLYDIVFNYENICKDSLYSQGDPFDHCVKFDISKPETDFQIVGRKLTESFKRPINHPAIGPILEHLWFELFDADAPDTVTFGTGALFKVRSSCIRRRSKKFYQKALSLSISVQDIGYAFERLWPVIFDHTVKSEQSLR